MLIINLDRERLLTFMPKGGVVAEVGVFRGDFAWPIRTIVEPDELHLIDPWGDNDPSYKEQRAAMLVDAYENVRGRFGPDIASGRVVLHRDFSTKVAPEFPDHYFDWIYVDGRHDYENAKSDLLAFKDKVKPDGLILGHDFSSYRNPRAFGVINAVLEFTKEEGFRVVMITNETNPSYVLARSGNATAVPALRTALLNQEAAPPIEIDDAFINRFQQIEVTYADRQTGQLIAFR